MKSIPTKLALKIYREELLRIVKGRHFNDAVERFLTQYQKDRVLEIKNPDLQAEYMIHLLLQSSEQQLQETLKCSDNSEVCRGFIQALKNFACIDCLRFSMIHAHKSILDEIDTDIIERTLKDQPDVPAFITKLCIEDAHIIQRAKRTKVFLQFVFVKGHLLLSFADVLATRTKHEMKYVKCPHCSGIYRNEKDEWINKTQFIFVVDDTGKLTERVLEDTYSKTKSVGTKRERKHDLSADPSGEEDEALGLPVITTTREGYG